MKYAGLWPRFMALLIDFLIFCLLFFPVTRLVKGVWLMSATDHRWAQGLFIFDPLCGIFLLFMFFYFVLLEGLLGVTVGKKLMGLQVVGLDGKNPGLVPGLLRNLLRLVDGLPAFSILGIYLIVTSPEKARYGDRVAKTRVMMKTTCQYNCG